MGFMRWSVLILSAQFAALIFSAKTFAQQNDAQSSMLSATLNMCPTLNARFEENEDDDSLTIEPSDGEVNLTNFCNALVGGEFANNDNVLQQVNGEEMQNVQSQITKIRDGQIDLAFARLAAARTQPAGGSGINLAGLNVVAGDQVLMGATADDQLVDSDVLLQGLDWGKLGLFVSGHLRLGDKDATSQADGHSFQAEGLMAGLDYRLSDQLIVGGGIGYSTFNVDFDNTPTSLAGQDLSSDGITLVGFGTLYPNDRFFIDGIVTLGWTGYKSERRIDAQPANPDSGNVTPVSGTIKGDFDAFHYGLAAKTGYELKLIGGILFTPTFLVNYVNMDVDGVNETGDNELTDAVSLSIGSHTTESLTSELGVEFSHRFGTPIGVLIPNVRAAYIHELLAKDDDIRIEYNADPTALSRFTLPTEDRDLHYGRLGADISAVLPSGFTVYVDYDSLVGVKNFDVHTFTFGFRADLGGGY